MRRNLSDHLANERTFLSWLRTSIAIIAFGFVLERFSLFLRYFVANGATVVANPHTDVLGAALIWVGTLLIVVSLWRFLVEQRNINSQADTTTANWPMVTLAMLLAAVGVYLALAIAL